MATIQEQLAKAKALIQAKKYQEARRLLEGVEGETAEKWRVKLDEKLDAVLDEVLAESTPKSQVKNRVAVVPPSRVSSLKTRARVWGILTLLSIAWMGYGLMATSSAYSNVVDETTSEAGRVGADIGATLSLGTYICTGLPFFIVFALLAWRNNAGLRTEQRHLEQLSVMRGG